MVNEKFYHKKFSTNKMKDFCKTIRRNLFKITDEMFYKEVNAYTDIILYKIFSSNNKKIQITEYYLKSGAIFTEIYTYIDEEKQTTEYFNKAIFVKRGRKRNK